VRVPAVVVIAVGEGDDRQVLDGVGDAGDLKEGVKLLQLG
jgi:hypothetical protein